MYRLRAYLNRGDDRQLWERTQRARRKEEWCPNLGERETSGWPVIE